jgi:hypothetical protein
MLRTLSFAWQWYPDTASPDCWPNALRQRGESFKPRETPNPIPFLWPQVANQAIKNFKITSASR